MENLVTIGQFAEAAQVTPKALRLYAANGLLAPARVDRDSGYRYYRIEQLHTARLISLLRSAGMSLRGSVTEESDGPVEVCGPRGDGDHELPAGEVAYTTASGEQCDFPQILGAYDAAARWAREHERDFAAPPREIYLSGPGETMRFEIAWPLR